MILGAVAAKAGGSKISTAVIRICFWGTAAMALTALVGYLFGVNAS
jgi:VIT1/CCC1 family predicted Fe2+/Mn2+ transporter